MVLEIIPTSVINPTLTLKTELHEDNLHSLLQNTTQDKLQTKLTTQSPIARFLGCSDARIR